MSTATRWRLLQSEGAAAMAMSDQDLFEEAEICRRRALAYVGQAEASFLLRVAAALDDVARERSAQNSNQTRPALPLPLN